jgi:hypothetical protein
MSRPDGLCAHSVAAWKRCLECEINQLRAELDTVAAERAQWKQLHANQMDELATVTAERDSARAMLAAVRVIAQCWRESEDGSEDNYCADDAMADLEEHLNGLA